MELDQKGHFDHVVVNSDLAEAVEKVNKIILKYKNNLKENKNGN
jgi:guanylate kinase